MTNTERLIESFKHCQREGSTCCFMVGRYTGNGPSVVAALRRRGYSVERIKGGYEITDGPKDCEASFADTNAKPKPASLIGDAGRLLGPDHSCRKGRGLVEEALTHIATIHPAVDQVVYDEDLRWCYSSGGIPITFTNKEDIGLLEDAADDAYSRGLVNVAVKI